MKIVTKLFKFWLPVVLWMGVIFFLSAQPNLRTELGIWDTVLRKVFHVSEFALLTFLLFRALREDVDYRKALFLSLIFAFLYSISDEYHQTFVSGREGTGRDFLIDSAGIVGMGLYLRIKKGQLRSQNSKRAT